MPKRVQSAAQTTMLLELDGKHCPILETNSLRPGFFVCLDPDTGEHFEFDVAAANLQRPIPKYRLVQDEREVATFRDSVLLLDPDRRATAVKRKTIIEDVRIFRQRLEQEGQRPATQELG